MVSAFAFVTAFVFVIGFTWNPQQDGILSLPLSLSSIRKV